MLAKLKLYGPIAGVVIALCALVSIPAFAATSHFSNFCLPPMQGNVTVATGYKTDIGSKTAYVAVTSQPYGGIFWIDRNTNDRATGSLSINGGTGGYLWYKDGGVWAGYAQLRACQQGWGFNGCDSISGYAKFG